MYPRPCTPASPRVPSPARLAALGTLCLVGAAPLAAEPLPGGDIAVLQNEEVKVVQALLYEKTGRLEVGAALGLTPVDPWVRSGSLGLTAAWHRSEILGFELNVHGLTGTQTAEADRLAALGVAVDSYSPRAIVSVDALVTPIYAKLNVLGAAVVHYDVYLAAGVGAFVARRSFLEGVETGDAELPAWNTPASLNIGLGQRFFYRAGDHLQSVRLDARDHLYLASNPDESRWVKHNLHLTLGWSIFF